MEEIKFNLDFNVGFGINPTVDFTKNNIVSIKVPQGIRYLSDWGSGFRFVNFPERFILDKQIPGCGFTEYCLRGEENVILCSPRKLLLKNKWDQHENDVYLVVNESDKDPEVDKDISKDRKDWSKSKTDKEIEEERKEQEDRTFHPGELFMEMLTRINNPVVKNTYSRIYNELYQYCSFRYNARKPIKILVTYDSYGLVQQILESICQRVGDNFLFGTFYTVVDEFQSILHDARFKSSTEIEFMGFLQRAPKVMFVSATPLLDKYMALLPEFDCLPYFKLDWKTLDPGRVVQPSLKILTMKSVGTKAEEVIQKYLNRKFDRAWKVVDNHPIEIISDEAVLYVNSVNHIISIIKKCNLQPEQVNILCANTEENKKKIQKKLGKKYIIGTIPKKGEKPKMFTFCTRTAYLGADFYSLCAQSYIFSDANSDCLAVDISDDLPQILGRQRLVENPWSNSATFFYRATADYKKMDQKDFEEVIRQKEKETRDLLVSFESAPDDAKLSLAKNYEFVAKNANYKTNYVAVNTHAGSLPKPVMNNLVLANELRVFYIQQFDYADRITVFTMIHERITPEDMINQEVANFFDKYKTLTTFRGKLKMLCESGLEKKAVDIVLDQIGEQDCIKSYYNLLGPDKLRALGYNRTYIEKALGIVVFSQDLLKQEIYNNFSEGEKYTLPNLKSKLGDIYDSVKYKATPKANDILGYFEVKEFMTTVTSDDGSKKRVRGYELLKSKRDPLEERLVD